MPASRPPKCPWCVKPMTLARMDSETRRRPTYRFECKRCIIRYTEVPQGDLPLDRARKLDQQPIRTLQ